MILNDVWTKILLCEFKNRANAIGEWLLSKHQRKQTDTLANLMKGSPIGTWIFHATPSLINDQIRWTPCID